MNNDFKIPAKYLIDFDTLKVGDRVWHIIKGFVIIGGIDKDEYPIIVGDDYYTIEGKFWSTDKYPSLFRSNPFEDIREEFFQDTLMEVRTLDTEKWTIRAVFGRKNDRWLAWNSAETMEEAKAIIGTCSWKYARPLTPPSEELVHLTLKDISEGKGKGVPAHLIRIKE